MRPFRLLILTPTALPVVTGNAMTAERWRRSLVGMGLDVRVLERRRPRRGRPEAGNRSLQAGSPPHSQCLSCRRAPSPSCPGALPGAAPACRVPFGNGPEHRSESRSRKREGLQGPEPGRGDRRPERRGKGKAARDRSRVAWTGSISSPSLLSGWAKRHWT